ncbi:hypothetical protein ACFL1E_00970 [Candidatus Omnitrophota bacterium]
MKNKSALVVMCLVCVLFFSLHAYAVDWGSLFGGHKSSNANEPAGTQAKPSQVSVKADGGGEGSGTMSSEPDISPSLPGSLGEGSDSGGTYIGTWLRQALYISGKLEHRTPATLIYTKDAFSAFGTCSTAGTISVSDNTIKTVMTQSDCPGGVKAPMTITYNYQITDEGKKLILTVGPVKEVYIRKE